MLSLFIVLPNEMKKSRFKIWLRAVLFIQLMEAGLRPTEIKEVWCAKVIYIHDPEGNRIEYWSGLAHT